MSSSYKSYKSCVAGNHPSRLRLRNEWNHLDQRWLCYNRFGASDGEKCAGVNHHRAELTTPDGSPPRYRQKRITVRLRIILVFGTETILLVYTRTGTDFKKKKKPFPLARVYSKGSDKTVIATRRRRCSILTQLIYCVHNWRARIDQTWTTKCVVGKLKWTDETCKRVRRENKNGRLDRSGNGVRQIEHTHAHGWDTNVLRCHWSVVNKNHGKPWWHTDGDSWPPWTPQYIISYTIMVRHPTPPRRVYRTLWQSAFYFFSRCLSCQRE